MDPFGFLDALFGGGGDGGFPTTQGGTPLNQGFSAIQGWAVGQAFSNAGPVGQYLGLLYVAPGTGLQNVGWERQQAGLPVGGEIAIFDFSDIGDQGNVGEVQVGPSVAPDAPSNPSLQPTSRILNHLDRDGLTMPVAVDLDPVTEITALGAPIDPPRDSIDDFLQRLRDGSYFQGPTSSGPERPIIVPDQPPPRVPRPRQPAVRKPSAMDTIAPTVQPQDPNPVDGGPYFDVPVDTRSAIPNPAAAAIPWMSDAAPPPEKLLPWGAWDRPERESNWAPETMSSLDRDPGRIETAPTVRPERTFLDRGGAGLAAGAFAAAAGVTAVMWWNPVGWAALGVALLIAGGIAATAASAVELGGSYGGVTSAEQDAQMNRAVSATLTFSSPGGIAGGILGMIGSDDPESGFEEGAFWGGSLEASWSIAASLPGALRALPGISSAVLPWAKSLMLEPLWFFLSAGGGGGNARSMARVFLAEGRIASRVRSVEFLGTTPLLETEKDWARFQIDWTRSRNESIFRITFRNGRQRIALVDGYDWTNMELLEAKHGNLGQMFIPARAAHIMTQAENNTIISNVLGGTTRYGISTELGAARLTQRFTLDFPSEMVSKQITVDWVRWRK